MDNFLEEKILHLYQEPAIGATYSNTYGEENIQSLVATYRSLDEQSMSEMMARITQFSQSADLATCFISVGVLHALGQDAAVQEAYQWAKMQEDSGQIISHFDIGKSVADYFTSR
ncbi:MAG: hypothetical protein HOL15_00835 [Nitrospinaceae bacterium]|nr:hypothetical protein [Nitrospina sp.]MBT5375340.1 hypothetical protein [Nitrospinaceae bacterium]MBT5869029.1 hypothetical protein [Nitrospinaceae bacterium]MBT6347067.1 hypothetical protein [Nitrospina sp.]